MRPKDLGELISSLPCVTAQVRSNGVTRWRFQDLTLLLLAWVGVLAEETVRTYRLSLIRPMEKEKGKERRKEKEGWKNSRSKQPGGEAGGSR